MADKKKIKHVLLTWEELPESICYFLIPFKLISKADMHMLLACHNNWIGSRSVNISRADRKTVEAALCRLNNVLSTYQFKMTESFRESQADNCGISVEEFDAIVGKWAGCKVDDDSPWTVPVSKMFRSGKIL